MAIGRKIRLPPPAVLRLAPALVAVAATAAHASESVVPTMGIVQMLIGLGFVVGLIVLASWMLRRMGAVPAAPGSLVRIIAAASVGPREKVILVEVQDVWLVLGVAPGRVTALHQLERQTVPQTEPGATRGFAKWLAEARRAPNAGGPGTPQ